VLHDILAIQVDYNLLGMEQIPAQHPSHSASPQQSDVSKWWSLPFKDTAPHPHR
jgi:hypothetical protein